VPHIIRTAKLADLPAITEIYNEAIRSSVSTMDTVEHTVAERRYWFDIHTGPHPLIVAESEGVIAGWASLSQWSNRPAYSLTAEGSVFIHADYRSKGIGKLLLTELLALGKSSGLHVVVARIATVNEVSLKMCRGLGFTDVGVMKEAGFKFGKYIDISVLQYLYP
jgi:L-amino acid N-acyltransferase YncA